MRLIDADELRKEIDKQAYPYSDSTANDIYFSVLHLLADAPTADAEPVRHGKWERRRANLAYDIYTCSNCGFEQWERNVVGLKWNYCPNCGAKMDGD